MSETNDKCEQVYDFPLMKVVDVPFEYEGNTYCFYTAKVVYENGKPYRFQYGYRGVEAPSQVADKVTRLLYSFYSMPKFAQFIFVERFRNEMTFDKLWNKSKIYLGDQYPLVIDEMTLVMKQLAMAYNGTPVESLHELSYWVLSTSGERAYDSLIKSTKALRNARLQSSSSYCYKNDWIDDISESILGF